MSVNGGGAIRSERWIRGDVVEIYFAGKCRMSNELPCTKMWCEGALTSIECNCGLIVNGSSRQSWSSLSLSDRVGE